MENSKKEHIKDLLVSYCERKGSANKAANAMEGVSNATISQMINNKWELITDAMWRRVGAYVGWSEIASWVLVDTHPAKEFNTILTDAQDNSLVMAVTASAGCGKTSTIKEYADNHENAFAMSCAEYYTKKYFLTELLSVLGRDAAGLDVPTMMMAIKRILKGFKNPIIILDEVDKLTDTVLNFFISLYNDLEDHCAIVLACTDFLELRITRGVRSNKKGYKEIYSRIGRRFIHLSPIEDFDVRSICMANGINQETSIKRIVAEAEDANNDLRRVKRLVHRELRKTCNPYKAVK